MKFLVIEIQTFDNNTIGTLTYDYDDRNEAESKYHSILAVAATSSLISHAAVLMTSYGQQIEYKCYNHPKPMVTPEEPETEEPTE